MTAPFTYLRAFFSPETFPIQLPAFIRTTQKSPNESALKKDLEEKAGSAAHSSALIDASSLNKQVLILDQFDKIVSYVEGIASNNWGEVEVNLRFDGAASIHYGPCPAKKFAAENREAFIKQLVRQSRWGVQFVLEVKYHFSSWFGERYENFRHAVIVDMTDGIKFK